MTFAEQNILVPKFAHILKAILLKGFTKFD